MNADDLRFLVKVSVWAGLLALGFAGALSGPNPEMRPVASTPATRADDPVANYSAMQQAFGRNGVSKEDFDRSMANLRRGVRETMRQVEADKLSTYENEIRNLERLIQQEQEYRSRVFKESNGQARAKALWEAAERLR